MGTNFAPIPAPTSQKQTTLPHIWMLSRLLIAILWHWYHPIYYIQNAVIDFIHYIIQTMWNIIDKTPQLILNLIKSNPRHLAMHLWKKIKHVKNEYRTAWRNSRPPLYLNLTAHNIEFFRHFYVKKYIYTINHKRIAMNYLYFTFMSGVAGALLATFIRLELAQPGSHFFKGDSVRYIQVITSHGLVMIFYVAVPIIFGMFANYFIPYHVGSKDVAYPRLNSIGFWILPSGFFLVAKPAFVRRQTYKVWDPYDAATSTQFNMLNAANSFLASVQAQATNTNPLNKHPSIGYTPAWNLRPLPNRDAAAAVQQATTGTYSIDIDPKYPQYFYWVQRAVTPPTSNLTQILLNKLKTKFKPSNGILCPSSYDALPKPQTLCTTNPPFETPNWAPERAHLKPMPGRLNSATGDAFTKLKYWSETSLLWEISDTWSGNIWSTLKNTQPMKNIVIRNHKCNSPTYVMSGWTFITPFSSQTRFTGVGSQDAATATVIFAGISTTLSFTNLLITRRLLSGFGIRNRKNTLPFLSIGLLLVMRMLAAITPVLGGAMVMLVFDRHLKTSFFDYAYGGDVILFHHLFWFFGHPEVYVIIIPIFGLVNSLLPLYNSRRVASKNHLIWATYVMAYMGFLVWGHHMYLVGLDHRSRSLYSTITVMISLPAVVKIVNWTLTLLNGSLCIDFPLIFITAFIGFFLSGGLTGLWLSHVGLNLFVHDTFYVVAHFHFMFSCATFSGIFAAIYLYFHVFFGGRYLRMSASLHCLFWVCGQWLTFIPLYWVGYNGLPRRYHDYPLMFAGWHGLASGGHILTMTGIACFFYTVGDSKIQRSKLRWMFYKHPRLVKFPLYLALRNTWQVNEWYVFRPKMELKMPKLPVAFDICE